MKFHPPSLSLSISLSVFALSLQFIWSGIINQEHVDPDSNLYCFLGPDPGSDCLSIASCGSESKYGCGMRYRYILLYLWLNSSILCTLQFCTDMFRQVLRERNRSDRPKSGIFSGTVLNISLLYLICLFCSLYVNTRPNIWLNDDKCGGNIGLFNYPH